MSEKSYPCPLCGFSAKYDSCAQERSFYRCGRCDLVFVPKEDHLPPKEEKERYELHDNTMENEGYVRLFTRKFPILREYWRDVRTVLDYGCGPGPVLVELLNREGYEAHGYDPYFTSTDPLSRCYDAVISTETFEHFSSPRHELQRINRLIRPGGYLTVTTRIRQNDTPLSEWWYVRDPTHVAFYSPKTFTWIARAHDLEMLYCNEADFVIYSKK